MSTKIFIKGIRLGRPLTDIFFTTAMSVFEMVLLKKIFWDINAQPNIIHKKFLKKLHNIPLDFSFDLFFYYNAKKQKLLRQAMDQTNEFQGM